MSRLKRGFRDSAGAHGHAELPLQFASDQKFPLRHQVLVAKNKVNSVLCVFAEVVLQRCVESSFVVIKYSGPSSLNPKPEVF